MFLMVMAPKWRPKQSSISCEQFLAGLEVLLEKKFNTWNSCCVSMVDAWSNCLGFCVGLKLNERLKFDQLGHRPAAALVDVADAAGSKVGVCGSA